jgi:preprotein translocase subunit YajC
MNKYFKILKIIYNYEKNEYSLIINNISKFNLEIIFYKSNYQQVINLKPNEINILKEIKDNIIYLNHSDCCEEIDLKNLISFSDKKNISVSGFSYDCKVETPNGPRSIGELNKGDKIYTKTGLVNKIKNVYRFDFKNSIENKIIKIKKSSCGINIPNEDIIMSIKNNLKIKKIKLKGKNLFMNKKAINFIYTTFSLFNLETENNLDFLVNGFISESINI